MNQLYWTSLTRFHDWYKAEKSIPKKMILEAREAGLIGEIEWIEVGIEEKHRYKYREGILEKYLDYRPLKQQAYLLSAGGEVPFKWKIDIGIFPYDQNANQVKGYNSFNLWIEAKNFLGVEGSNHLSGAFREINSAFDIEFSSIHPFERYGEITDTVFGEYGDPVTFQPMFFGVFWLIYLGSKHLAYFDTEKLQHIKANHVDWVGEGLLVQVCPDVYNVIEREIENEMFRLTNQFKGALTL